MRHEFTNVHGEISQNFCKIWKNFRIFLNFDKLIALQQLPCCSIYVCVQMCYHVGDSPLYTLCACTVSSFLRGVLQLHNIQTDTLTTKSSLMIHRVHISEESLRGLTTSSLISLMNSKHSSRDIIPVESCTV